MKSARNTAVAWAMAAAFLPMIGEANAQVAFTGIQALGDSYVDNGNLFKILGVPNPPQYPTGRLAAAPIS